MSMESHDVMKAMKRRANEMGWAVETNWRDNDDGTDAYDVYLWQVSGAETRTSEQPYACPACGTRYGTPEHAAGCEVDHDRSDVTDEACTEERPCKECLAGIRDLGYSLYDEPAEVRLAVHGTPWAAPADVDAEDDR